MKKIFNIGIILLVVSNFLGCYDDKGNYGYDWITSVSVANLEKSYTYAIGDAFVLRPDLEFLKREGDVSLGGVEDYYSEDTYAYYWIARRYDKHTDRIVEDTIGRERNLNYIVDLPAEEYLVVYQICNQSAGMIWSVHFQLNVTRSAPEGWLFLEDNEGSAELSIYARLGDGSMHMERNMLAASGIPADKLVGPRQVFATYQNQVGNGVWILTDHFTGYLDVKSGHKWTERQVVQNHLVESVNKDFVFQKVQGLMFFTVFGFSEDGLRVSRYPGMLYTADLLPIGEKRFEIAPYVATIGDEVQTKQVLIFDETHRHFKYLDISGSFTWLDADENFPVDYDLKYMAVVGEIGSQKIRCLLTKEDGVYEFVASSATQFEIKVKKISDSEKFRLAEECVYHHFLQLPYYLYDGKLYVNTPEHGDKEVEYYRLPEPGEDIPAGETVLPAELEGNIVHIATVGFTDINMDGYQYRRGFMNHLIVTTELPDGSGKVYFLAPEPSNAYKLTISDMITTDHKVVSVDYQRPNI